MFRLIVMTALAVGCATAEISVPKDATEIEPGVYKHTDSAGKTYIFQKDSVRIVKSLDGEGRSSEGSKPAAEPSAAAKASPSTATPFGEVKTTAPSRADQSHRPRRRRWSSNAPSPFGSYKWKAKKSELTDSEREAWEQLASRQTTASGPKE